MPDAVEDMDFGEKWLAKLSGRIDRLMGAEAREKIMAGSTHLDARSEAEEIIAWTRDAMERLEDIADPGTASEIMTGCSCQYPRSGLKVIRDAYRSTGNVDLAHGMLQERFISFLEHDLELDRPSIEGVIERGWGLAGVRRGNAIVATKIPKSGNLASYLQEADAGTRREYYCHCPRIRKAITTGQQIPSIYCYCGAGYYKGIWEEILGKPVGVEILKTVLKGDEVCSFLIHLPPWYKEDL